MLRPGQTKIPNTLSDSKPKRRTAPAELSLSSSLSVRKYSAKDAGFENGLRDLNFKPTTREAQPDAKSVAEILEIMERERDSPPPDSENFYEVLSFIETENEAMVINELTLKLLPFRHTSRNNGRTQHLLYRLSRPWQEWGSAKPGILPLPEPDCCITLKSSAFTEDQKSISHLLTLTEPGIILFSYVRSRLLCRDLL